MKNFLFVITTILVICSIGCNENIKIDDKNKLNEVSNYELKDEKIEPQKVTEKNSTIAEKKIIPIDSSVLEQLDDVEQYKQKIVPINGAKKKVFTGNSILSIHSIIDTNNDEFIAIGETGSDSGKFVRIGDGYENWLCEDVPIAEVWVAKFDSDFNILWKKTIKNDEYSFSYPIDIYESSENIYELIFATIPAMKQAYEEGKTYYGLGNSCAMRSISFDENGVINSKKEIDEYKGQSKTNWYNLYDSKLNVEVDLNVYSIDDSVYFKIKEQYVGRWGNNFRIINCSDSGYLLYSEVYEELFSKHGINGIHKITQEIYTEKYKKYCDPDNYEYIDFETFKFDFTDVLVIKLDENYKMEWYRYCGGTGQDIAYNVCESEDGRFYFTGMSWSQDGDVIGWSGDVFTHYDATSSYENPTECDWGFILSQDGELEYSELNDLDYEIVSVKNIFNIEKSKISFANDFGYKGDSTSGFYGSINAYKLAENKITCDKISGVFSGQYENNSGVMDISIEIFEVKSNADIMPIKANVLFNPSKNNKVGKAGFYFCRGTVNMITGTVSLYGEEWISNQPEEYNMLDIQGQIKDGIFDGYFDRANNAKLKLKKVK